MQVSMFLTRKQNQVSEAREMHAISERVDDRKTM